MAITIITQPSSFGRIYDTNRLMYKFSSNNSNQPNFRFYIDVMYQTNTKIGTVRKRPLSDGTCFFNPAELWSNYLSYDLEIGIDELKEALNSNNKFYIIITEEYGEPPEVISETEISSTSIMLYNGIQEYIPYDIEDYGGGNLQFVMNSGSTGYYLTDSTNFQVDVNDYSNLYFIAPTASRPTHCRVKVYYWGNPSDLVDVIDGGGIAIRSYTDNPEIIYKNVNLRTSAPNPVFAEDPGDIVARPPIPRFKDMILSYYTGFTLDYTTSWNQMYYIPTGPKELQSMGMFNGVISGSTWASYEIDLTNGILSGSTIWNTYPMTYYRKTKCNKYNPIQLFWLNPHGGFDRYTFYKKNYISYDIERTLWEHRFSDTYVLGERGTTVYKTKSKENIELNTDWLSSSESQILSQLELSPEVYAVYEYKNNVYKIPYIINDTSFDYKEIKNEKMVSMKINITPAFNRVSQTS